MTPAVLGVRLAVAVVVVDPLGLVYRLDPRLVVDPVLVGLVVLALVVVPVDLLDPLVAHRAEARGSVAQAADARGDAVGDGFAITPVIPAKAVIRTREDDGSSLARG